MIPALPSRLRWDASRSKRLERTDQLPDVLVIDTRNDYEYRAFRWCGGTRYHEFTEFPMKDNLNPEQQTGCNVLHRRDCCEKSTSLLVEAGFEEVYHLHGGILKYLEHVKEEESLAGVFRLSPTGVFSRFKEAISYVSVVSRCHLKNWPRTVTRLECALY